MSWYKFDYAGCAFVEARDRAQAKQFYEDGMVDYQEQWVTRSGETDVSEFNSKAHGPAHEGVKGKHLQTMYDDIVQLQEELRFAVASECGTLDSAYLEIKALAATYELQEFLANQIGAAIAAGELEEEEA